MCPRAPGPGQPVQRTVRRHDLPLPFLNHADASLWQTAVGYEIAGIIGILLVGLAIWGAATLLTGLRSGAARTRRLRERSRGRPHRVAGAHRRRHRPVDRGCGLHRGDGAAARVAQARDPRAKLAVFVALVLAASLSTSLAVLAGLYAVVVLAAAASRIPTAFFVKRTWLGIPLFAGIVILPSIFFVPGPRLFEVAFGPVTVAPSASGLASAIVFVSRVGVSVSLAVLLIVSTPWADVLRSLRTLHVPQVFILVLSMTYRYIFLFLHTANGILEARRAGWWAGPGR